MKRLLPSLALLFCTLPSAWAQSTTYTYTSAPYSSATGIYNTSMGITISFTMPDPLPASLNPDQSNRTTLVYPTDWTVSDGVNTYTAANASLLNTVTYSSTDTSNPITVSTDAQGDIIGAYILVYAPQLPHDPTLTTSSMIGLSFDSGHHEIVAMHERPCTIQLTVLNQPMTKTLCAPGDAGGSEGKASNTPGRWTTTTAAPAPTPAPTLPARAVAPVPTLGWQALFLLAAGMVGAQTMRRKDRHVKASHDV